MEDSMTSGLLDPLFRPKSVAVIGASSRENALGREIFYKLIRVNFNGPVFPVHPSAEFIHAVKAYRSILDIPQAVDLAVIVTPKQAVLQAVKECVRHGVRSIVINTAGFKEIGEDGAALEGEILEIVRQAGVRLIGPNCMGIINTEEQIRLDTTFAPVIPSRGKIGLVSQSGALGQTILEHADELGLGVSMFASIGNKADVSGNDLLEYWFDEDSIEVVLMYLEGFDDPRRFFEIARKTSPKKPIIVVKSGRTRSGAKAALSHTGALAGMDQAFDAMFAQCGVVRAATLDEMFDMAMGFAYQPLPGGRRVAVITNAGGPGIMTADACEAHNLMVAELAAETKQSLRSALAYEASVENPVDLLASARPEDFQKALQHILTDPGVDAVIVIFVAPVITNPEEVARKIAAAVKELPRKPVLGCFMGMKGMASGVQEMHRSRIPAYAYPESAVRALAAMVRYGEWVNRSDLSQKECVALPESPSDDSIVSDDKAVYRTSETLRLIHRYGIQVAPFLSCTDDDELLSAAEEIGYPVTLKIDAEAEIHKSDIGGIIVRIQNEEELRNAVRHLRDKGEGESLLVQEYVSGGREMILGMKWLPGFGHLLMFGLGGIYAEFLNDVSFRLHPVIEADADEMIRGIRAYALLEGVRGHPPADLHHLRNAIVSLSRLANNYPQIRELDINPLIFDHNGIGVAVDARVIMRSADDLPALFPKHFPNPE
jgi:acetyltransferase